MTLLDALLGEHGALYAMFEHIEKDGLLGSDLGAAKAQAALLRSVLLSHATLEDEILFPALEAAIGPDGPLAVMRMEHDRIEGALEDLADASTLEEARDLLLGTIAAARPHFAKEEQVLFGLAARHIPPARMSDLTAAWAERRGVASPLLVAHVRT